MKKQALVTSAVLAASVAGAHATINLIQIGLDDNEWPVGDGGGANATFVQEAGTNPLPGVPNSPEVNQMADDDYYMAGSYTTVLDGGGYTPVGPVAANEEAAERAFAGSDNFLRYHFNLPSGLPSNSILRVQWDALNLHIDEAINPDPRYGVEVWFNNVQVGSEVIIRPAEIDVDFWSDQFTMADVNAEAGPGFDNYFELRGINYNGDGGGNWMGVDYVQLDVVPEPSPAGMIAVCVGAAFVLRRFRSRR